MKIIIEVTNFGNEAMLDIDAMDLAKEILGGATGNTYSRFGIILAMGSVRDRNGNKVGTITIEE